MGDATDDSPSPGESIERALIEAHHLANLTGLDAAELARQRLVNAQSASRRTKTRDLLADACEYLELARLERRDAAAGFAKARRHARNAELGLRQESPVGVERSVVELLRGLPEREGRSLEELHRDVSVGSFDGLRRDTALELAFAEIRSQTTEGVIEDPNALDAGGEPMDSRVVEESSTATVEEALRTASLEVDIRRALQRAREASVDSKFQFLSSEQLVDDEATETGESEAAGGPD